EELLVAMGRDANNQMYPIAWAVVKVKNNEHWCWFISLIQEDLQLETGEGLTIISDSHKGLLEGVIELLPNAEHRKAFFRQESKCPNFENGICKSFNRAILVQRTKPIITMLEDIRLYVMQRLVAMNRVARTWEHNITPSIRKRVEVLKKKQRDWMVIPSGFQVLEVRKGHEAYGVGMCLITHTFYL
ncbi:splicing factor, partial [Tanacetum coccineum]